MKIRKDAPNLDEHQIKCVNQLYLEMSELFIDQIKALVNVDLDIVDAIEAVLYINTTLVWQTMKSSPSYMNKDIAILIGILLDRVVQTVEQDTGPISGYSVLSSNSTKSDPKE